MKTYSEGSRFVAVIYSVGLTSNVITGCRIEFRVFYSFIVARVSLIYYISALRKCPAGIVYECTWWLRKPGNGLPL